MARTKGAKNKKPAKSVTKKRDFALVHPKNAPGSGLPSNYLYGKSSSGSNKAAAPRRKFKPVRKNGPPPPSKSFSVKVKLHDKQHGMIVPWRRNVAKSQKPHTKSSKVQQLNGFLVKESSLHHLNQELIQFADYVKLTAAEREARERIIQNIKSVCRQVFGIDDKDCQTFGSFAVPGVCTFSSDVDMAIWGAVAKDEDDALEDRNEATVTTQDPNRKRIVSLAEAEGFHSEDDQKMCSISNSLQDHPNRKKQERLLRWKKALDQTWMATPSANKQPALESQQTGDEVQIDPSQNTKSEEGNGLFVLDRMGVEECGDGQKSKAEESSEHGESDSRKQDESDKDKESCNGNDSDDDDSDDADKLEALWLRAGQDEAGFVNRSESVAGLQFAEENDDGEEEEEEEEEGMVIKSNRPRGQSMVSLSSATTCSEDERFDDSALEVSYTVDRTGGKQTLGPTGRDRTAVVNALYKIARRMRPHAATLHVRKKAKVPIINFQSHFGFEVDIAMGGHNGTDTSSYASAQVSRFSSFSTLVVVLKVLLTEHNFDKPFTGGLGSFSLYVMVAHHLERHINAGGNDDAAEALLAFFFRYGSVKRTSDPSSCTMLSQRVILKTSDGGSTDLASCHQIESIVKLFELCHRALLRKLSGEMNQKDSVLQAILNPLKLEIGRSQARRQASIRLSAERGNSSNLNDTSSFVNVRAPQAIERNKNWMVADTEAEKLIRSYGRKVDEFFPQRGQGKRKRGESGGRANSHTVFAPLETPKQVNGKKSKQSGKGSRKRRKSG